MEAATLETTSLCADNARPRRELEALRAENARLRAQNRKLRAALDAHVRRASATSLYGPLELTAGTCIGPHRRRE